MHKHGLPDPSLKLPIFLVQNEYILVIKQVSFVLRHYHSHAQPFTCLVVVWFLKCSAPNTALCIGLCILCCSCCVLVSSLLGERVSALVYLWVWSAWVYGAYQKSFWALQTHPACKNDQVLLLAPRLKLFHCPPGSEHCLAKGPFWISTGLKGCPSSFFLASVEVGMFVTLLFNILMTPSLCCNWWWESHSRYWSVCVGFL